MTQQAQANLPTDNDCLATPDVSGQRWQRVWLVLSRRSAKS